MRDTNGNTISAGYAGGRLIGLTHSSGGNLAITYTAAGRIGTVTDSAGRQAVYTYDAADEHLLGVQTPAGTTTYTYGVGGTATEHALTSVMFPDGTHRFFAYDAGGRLAGTSRDGNAEPFTYAYGDPGELVATDGLGHATRTFYDYRGLPVKVRDPLGNVTTVTYDPATLRVGKVTDPTGQTTAYTYDARGNLASTTDALGHTTRYTHGALGRLASRTDAAGNTTAYRYDPAGNLLATEYANGTTERATFDPLGRPLSYTNRRDQAVGFTYNAAGQMTRQTFPDGSRTEFTYDARGNLRTATGPTGVITFGYDAADRLTRVDYPGGTFLQFTLDAAGRRTRMTDHTGFVVTYTHDAAGRLSGLRDGSGAAVVTYSYDAVGRLSRKDHANGTFTTYDYDAAGRILHLVNRAPGGVVNSRFDYTYDALGRRTTIATVDGTWTYTYDGVGRLTRGAFASTNAAVPSQDLVYAYDALGNRTTTSANGVATTYASNDLNQYTSVGGVARTYDADGNLLTDGANTYTYDVFGRMLTAATPAGTTTYTYDAIGNRATAATGGQTTRYLTDPTGVGGVVGEFGAGGAAVTHNTFGLGLTSRSSAGGDTYYYDFDGSGSTAAFTDPSGAPAGTYTYQPFGVIGSAGGGVPNPYTFGGQAGAVADPGGTVTAAVGTYQPATGSVASRPSTLSIAGLMIDTLVFAAGESVDAHERAIRAQVAASGLTPVGSSLDDAIKNWRAGVDLTARVLRVIDVAEIGYDLWDALSTGQLDATGLTLDVLGLVARANPIAAIASLQWQAGQLLREYFRDDIAAWADRNPALGDRLLAFVEEHPWFGQLWSWLADGVPFVTTDDLLSVINGIAGAFDPNDKIAPGGYGAGNFIRPTRPFPYRINFENDKNATAPAQAVTVTDQLSPLLDWDSFRLTELGFGDVVLAVQPDSAFFQTAVPMTLNGKAFDVLVEAGIDAATGRVYARFQSVDPLTQLPPDVLTGFLPPEDDTGRGQGHVSFTVRPKPSLTTGTQIRNVALITFDVNAPISTDQVDPHDPSKGIDPNKQALVTIDVDPPTGAVNPLPAVTTTAGFAVSWGAADGAGSGGATYDVFVSDNGGAFQPWLVGTPLATATYPGQDGHTYGFFVTATDGVGLREPSVGGTAEATTTVRVPVVPPPSTPAPPALVGFPQFGVGADHGGAPVVQYFNPDGSSRFASTVFDGTAAGVRTAAADFTGDGIADLVVGTGPGVATLVRVLDGVTQAELFVVPPFEAACTSPPAT